MNTFRFLSGLPVRALFAALLLAAALPAGAQTLAKRWFPGHYLYAADDVRHLGMMETRRSLVRYNKNFAGYKNQYWWHRLEPSKGVYDFSVVLADLDKAHADGKKMIVLLMERSFHASSRPFPMPNYIRYDMKGTWQDGEKIFIKAWDPAVTERFILLVEALARAVDGHPAFQMLAMEESSMGPISAQSGYSHAKVADYWMKLAKRGQAAVKNGIFMTNYNWGLSSSSVPTRQQVTDYVVDVARAGIGATDVRLGGSTATLTTSFGYVFDRYKGKAPMHASVEWNTFAMGWTPKQMVDFGVDRLGLHFMGWQARTSTSGVTFNINDAIAEINRQGGRINRTAPRNVLAGSTATGTVSETEPVPAPEPAPAPEPTPEPAPVPGEPVASPTPPSETVITSPPNPPRNLRVAR